MKELIPELMQIVASKFVTKPLYLAAQLGLPDLLQDGPLSVDELATRTSSHPPSLYRLLRALASVGIFEETEGRRFRNTPRSEMFQNRVGSLRGMLLWINDPRHDRAWENLAHCVKTGETAIPVTFGGREVWQWLRDTPDLFAIFNEAMTSNAHNLHAAAAAACDFSGFRRLVDVGGGRGGLLASILDRTPGLHGVVFDQAAVVDQARAALAARGLGSRSEAIGGDFFASVPEGDAHILSFVIHDWDDERSTAILRNIHRAQPNGGRVFLVEIVIPEGNEPSFGKFVDIEMLCLAGGRERTRAEYASVFDAAGFRLVRVVATESPCSVLEAERVG